MEKSSMVSKATLCKYPTFPSFHFFTVSTLKLPLKTSLHSSVRTHATGTNTSTIFYKPNTMKHKSFHISIPGFSSLSYGNKWVVMKSKRIYGFAKSANSTIYRGTGCGAPSFKPLSCDKWSQEAKMDCNKNKNARTESLDLTTDKEGDFGSFSLSGNSIKGVERYCKKNKTSLDGKKRDKFGRSFVRSRDEKKTLRLNKTKIINTVDEIIANQTEAVVDKSDGESTDGLSTLWSKMEKVDRKLQNKMTNPVVDGKIEKKSKKAKANPAELKLRVGLDMCSKRGDVMGAISIYDSALKEDMKLGQYHYNVLLYLCSSASMGVVQPAKSGTSTSRRPDKLDSIGETPKRYMVDSSEQSQIFNGGVESVKLNSSSNAFSHDLSNDVGDKCFSDRRASCPNDLDIDDEEDSLHQGDQSASSSKGFGRDNSEGVSRIAMNGSDCKVHDGIRVSDAVKQYALTRGFEIYEKMCSEKIPLSEAALTSVARMAMSMGNGDIAFEMVKKMKELDINPRLRSYGPALFAYCANGDLTKAFEVEQHMLESGVYPEEPELEALLRLSVIGERADKVYHLVHKLRASVRKVSLSTADVIEKWFKSTVASRVGKRKLNRKEILQAIENGGGGWHGLGWLGRGKWTVIRSCVGSDGVCAGCGEKLATIDLDPVETENFAKSVVAIAEKRERKSSFEAFQKWLDYHGPFEAVVDAANVGLFTQRRFSLSKVNAVVNGIRQQLPAKRWPLIVVHHKRIIGGKMNVPPNKTLIEKWKNADALYATPTGSNDDWYWLYAAIKFRCLIVTNDEMRDHIFQTLGNDFFPKWKERHQVRFSFPDGSPKFEMPPPCSVVIQESDKGHWHVPILSEQESKRDGTWLCVTRMSSNTKVSKSDTEPREESHSQHISERAALNTSTRTPKHLPSDDGIIEKLRQKVSHRHKNLYRGVKKVRAASKFPVYRSIISDLENAEKQACCVIDFQI